jgi:hypothetical protein
MRVQNMTSSRGNKVPNQFIIQDIGVTYFQSYDTTIVKRDFSQGKIFIDKGYPYSTTTSKYASQFLGETSKEIKRKIKDGTYILTDLNK